MKKTMFRFLTMALTVVCVGLQAQAITLQEIARFDVDGTADPMGNAYIGTNPASVAWDGRTLYVAGFNNGPTTADVSIVAITNGTATGLQTATYGARFGVLTAATLRGYSGLDISGNSVAAAADTTGGSIPEGIAAFDLAGTPAWTKAARGGSGVGFDPGFASADAGVGWTTFGSGRRALQDTAGGADIYTTANGMIINGTGTGTFWRDMNFSPNGDIWLREGNNVIQGVRSGGNSLSATNLVVDEPEADFVNLQTIAYMDGVQGGDLVIYNDRESAADLQNPLDVLKIITPSGASVPVNLSLLAGVNTGNGAYDFSWDSATQTLAISDFANRNVHIFSVVPEPASLGLAALAGLCLLGIRRQS